MDADGSNQTSLTNDAGGRLEPAWSPDGSKIAFITIRDGNARSSSMDADGSNQTNLTNNPSATTISPAWSPDGSKIAFTSTATATTRST